ncbi:hypothetical protein [Silvibacterium acidisoli]|uniref:hypothetical protein n=1 Tax=Acidobacteriaceae bacterium ZG23-2 TaxID=2883246 RepID=UPI00406D3E91
MKSSLRNRIAAALLLSASLTAFSPRLFAQAPTAATASQPEAILHPAEAAKILPDQVFFRGQTATTQARNATGVRYADGFFTLSIIVDNSGYSSGIQDKYQAYLLTEVPLSIGGHNLPPGTYGVGITKASGSPAFQVMDIGAHDLFSAQAVNDLKLHRPTPLQILAGSTAGQYRLYFGRNYVEFTRAK